MTESFDVSVKDLLKASPYYFIREVFGYRVDGIHGRMIDFFMGNKYSLVLAPRGHGKSKIMQGIITWMIVNDPNRRVILVSDTDTKAQMFLRTIKSTIENSAVLKEFYGDLKGDRWTDHSMVIAGRNEIHTEPSLLSVGAGSGAVTGMHCDSLFIDDIVSFDSSRGETQRARIKDWYRTTLLPVLLATGDISIAGTRYHYSDFYDLIKEELEYPTEIFSAINEDGTALCEWLVPLHDEISPSGKIVKLGLISIKKALGRIIFALQYSNDVRLLKEGNIFRDKYIQYYDGIFFDDGKIFVQRGDFRTEIKKIHIGGDLAISQQDTAAYCAFIAVGMGEDHKLYVLEVVRDKLTFSQQKKAILKLVEKWKPMSTRLEAVGYQAALVQEMQAEGGMKVVPIFPTRDKVSRANQITGWFENSNIYILKNAMSDLVDELLLFPDGTYKDQVDALVFAINGFKTPGSEMVVINI
jgi:predicted phage terminase large subunit-like protein